MNVGTSGAQDPKRRTKRIHSVMLSPVFLLTIQSLQATMMPEGAAATGDGHGVYPRPRMRPGNAATEQGLQIHQQ